jgi:F-type H+-transporting ATPase subunit a
MSAEAAGGKGIEWFGLLTEHFHMQLPGLNEAHTALVLNTWFVMLEVLVVVGAVALSLKRIPGGWQNFVELVVGFLEGFISDIAGHDALRYFPVVITAFLFILFSNYTGLVFGFVAPTSSLNTTLAWALIVFLFYNGVGFQKHGIKYLKHFVGPIWWLSWLMTPIEVISHIARPISLSMRLYANILAGEKIIGVLMFGGFIWMLWESVITAPIQSFVFSMMIIIYLAGAIGSDEH